MIDRTNLAPRALAAAERQAPTLRISYDGDPVRVDPKKITEDMLVPDAGEIECGQAAASLIDGAVTAGALTTPADLEIDCFADDDSVGGLFMLVIGPDGERHGATYGWHEVENLSGASVEGALNFCADQLNRALNPPTAQSSRCTRPDGIEISQGKGSRRARAAREAFRLKRSTLLARVRADYGSAEGINHYEEEGLAGALDRRVRDAVECGAVSGPENTEVQTYAVGDSLIVCVREETVPLDTQQRQVATFSLEMRELILDDGSYRASREAVEVVLEHATNLLPALRALQATGR